MNRNGVVLAKKSRVKQVDSTLPHFHWPFMKKNEQNGEMINLPPIFTLDFIQLRLNF